MQKQEITKLLESGICEVTFIKADKTHRNMICTLVSDYIDKVSAGRNKNNPEVVTVWDLEKEDWRAFRLDSLLKGPTMIDV